MDDVAEAIKVMRKQLIAGLPKMHRDGKVLIDGLTVEVEPVEELVGV